MPVALPMVSARPVAFAPPETMATAPESAVMVRPAPAVVHIEPQHVKAGRLDQREVLRLRWRILDARCGPDESYPHQIFLVPCYHVSMVIHDP